jgi:hypothetical protein
MTLDLWPTDRARFLARLAAGWRLPFLVEPMPGNHGRFAILLERPLEASDETFEGKKV